MPQRKINSTCLSPVLDKPFKTVYPLFVMQQLYYTFVKKPIELLCRLTDSPKAKPF